MFRAMYYLWLLYLEYIEKPMYYFLFLYVHRETYVCDQGVIQ
jgi:hypothetical protein